ncbi:MAG TPA: hypothetical protein VK499_09865 [Propionibacteriaceae bacterium]|nr:hypothetical protein [Propionibacteriaceae bacterium]
MSKVTDLATAQLSATDTLVIELVEANETPAVVIIRWPAGFPYGIPDASPTPLPQPQSCSLMLPHGWRN